MFVLETDTLTHLQHRHPRVMQRLAALDPSEEMGITVVSRGKILRGRFGALFGAATLDELLRAQERLTRAEEFLDEISTYPIDYAAAVQFLRLTANRKVRKIGRADLLIACIALTQRAILVTRNLRHFQPIADLTVVNWVD